MTHPIYDRPTWNALSHDQRSQAIEALLDQIGPDFQFIDLKTYTCHTQTNTVGRFDHTPTKMRFHLLPGGELKLGSGPHDALIHAKYLQNAPELYEGEAIKLHPFLISEYLITEDAWRRFDGRALHWQFGPAHPIDAVERYDVRQWVKKVKGHLPSEVEWEYACRAGSTDIFFWGPTPNLDWAWIDENRPQRDDYYTMTAQEQKPPNAFGLLGMIGNLAEWVDDDERDFNDGPRPSQLPFRSGDDNGILRGGWNEYGWKFNRTTSRITCAVGDTGCSARLVFRPFGTPTY